MRAGVIVLACCGWKELYNVSAYTSDQFSSTLHTLYENTSLFVRSRHGLQPKQGALLFTANQRGSHTYAHKFARDLENAGLGCIVALPEFTNPNTGNCIQTFMWIIDPAATRKHDQQLRKEKECPSISTVGQKLTKTSKKSSTRSSRTVVARRPSPVSMASILDETANLLSF